MAETEARSWGASRTTTQAGAGVQQYDSTVTHASQPDWRQSKAAADVAWTATRSLLCGLGFLEPATTCMADDRRGIDIVATQNGRRVKLAWRTRDRKFIGHKDVTLRAARPSGRLTEVDKLRAGAVDLLLWTWTSTTGAVCDWLLLDATRVVPMLDKRWPELHMPDATACCIPWAALNEAGAIVTCSRGVQRGL